MKTFDFSKLVYIDENIAVRLAMQLDKWFYTNYIPEIKELEWYDNVEDMEDCGTPIISIRPKAHQSIIDASTSDNRLKEWLTAFINMCESEYIPTNFMWEHYPTEKIEVR